MPCHVREAWMGRPPSWRGRCREADLPLTPSAVPSLSRRRPELQLVPHSRWQGRHSAFGRDTGIPASSVASEFRHVLLVVSWLGSVPWGKLASLPGREGGEAP